MVRIEVKGGDITRWFETKAKKIDKGLEEAIDRATKDGESMVKHMIETRGTGKTWKHPRDGKKGSYPGRVTTGNMRDSITSTTTKSTNSVEGRFGWLSNQEDYFRYQEEGFTHIEAGPVEGMYALVDAAEETFNNLKDDVERTVRDA